AVLWEGGGDNSIIGNTFTPNTSGTGGGSQLQLNPLGESTNSGYLVQSNTFDSSGISVIAHNAILITDNYIHNQTLGNTLPIFVLPDLNPSVDSDGVTIDSNTMDGTVGGPNN